MSVESQIVTNAPSLSEEMTRLLEQFCGEEEVTKAKALRRKGFTGAEAFLMALLGLEEEDVRSEQ